MHGVAVRTCIHHIEWTTTGAGIDDVMDFVTLTLVLSARAGEKAPVPVNVAVAGDDTHQTPTPEGNGESGKMN